LRTPNAPYFKALLGAGADLMARAFFGETPLHWAALCDPCEPDTIQILLSVGANSKAKDKNGKTPWNLAHQNKNLKNTRAYWALNDARYN
jgi:ankyrin repeat protein